MTEKQADGNGGGGDCEPTMRKNEAEIIREMQLSIAASASVFPGFRFSPTDDELISYYLKKKLQGYDNGVDIIPEVDFCRHEPWDLSALSIIQSNNEWFFFSTRGKKYPSGSHSKRATQSGYWKATGKERNVKSGAVTIGTKRTLVFHTGRSPKGERTEWIMHEYCTSDNTQEFQLVVCRLIRRNDDFRLTESSRGSSATNENANTQVDGNATKTCSKEPTSSYRSHSTGQSESESESNRELIHESPHGSSIPFKDFDNEDDCFADIINDDIVKLDESASTKYMQKLPQETMPSHGQGTAERRIKLRRQKGQTQHGKPPISHGGQNQPPAEKQSSGCVISVLSGNAKTLPEWFHPTHLILVFLFLLILVLVARQGFYLNSKQHLGSNMEVFPRGS